MKLETQELITEFLLMLSVVAIVIALILTGGLD